MSNFGSIPSGLTIGASQSVRRNAANNAFEVFTATADGLLPSQTSNSGKFLTTNGSVSSWATVPTGITIGSTGITGGTNNRLLFQASGNVSQSANLTFTGDKFTVKSGADATCPLTIDANSTHTGYLLEIGKNGNPAYFRIDKDGNICDIGGVGKRIQGNSTGVYFPDGLVVNEIPSSANGTAIFKTDYSGNYPFIFIAPTTNVGRAVTLKAASGQSVPVLDIVDSGFTSKVVVDENFRLGVGAVSSLSAKLQVRSTTEQMRVEYDASNYYKTTVASNGAATFDAVGSGAKFIFSDKIETPVSLEVTGAGQGLILVDGFGGRWEIVVDTFGVLNVNSI